MKRSTRNNVSAMATSKRTKNTDNSEVANVNKEQSKILIGSSQSRRKTKGGSFNINPSENNAIARVTRGSKIKEVVPSGSSQESDTHQIDEVDSAQGHELTVGAQRARGRQSKVPSAKFQDGDMHFAMSVQATEEQFGHSEDEQDMDIDPTNASTTSSHEIVFRTQRSRRDDDEESVKVLPISAEDKLKQIQDIDDEMLEKLTELRDIMSQGGMEKSSKFVQEFLLPPGPPGGSQDKTPPRVELPVRGGMAVRKINPPTHQEDSGTRISFARDREPVNTNFNHRPVQVTGEKTVLSRSAETIYKNAVQKRVSSSSEEYGIDTSDENLDLIPDKDFQPDYFDDLSQEKGEDQPYEPEVPGSQSPQLGPSSRRVFEREEHLDRPEMEMLTPHQISAKNTVAAENNKATLFPRTGNDVFNNFRTTAMMDEEYLVIGSHIDVTVQEKIINGEYIDFGKLIPKDRVVSSEEDNRLELVIRNGKTFWLPVTESVQINSFSKWEQAFRIYANVYTRKHPHRSSELIQYNHVIHTISWMFTWDNVYNYDKEFRLHMAKHRDCNWAIILHQAWAMRLKDRLGRNEPNFFSVGSGGGQSHTQGNRARTNSTPNGKGSGEPCRRFNRGKCPFGPKCRYEHCCAYEPCGKFGHSILNCGKLAADRERNSGKRSHPDGQRTVNASS